MPGLRLLPVSAGRSASGARSDPPPAGMNAGRMGLRLRAVARRSGGGELRMAALAAVAGVAAGYGAVGFRLAIDGVHFVFFGAGSEGVVEAARALEWQRVLLAPALGGLGVGLPIHFLMPERRPHAVADVIAARAVRGGKLPLRDGLAQALASAASIGVGASVGREGPVVHLAAAMGSWLGQRFRLDRTELLTLLGCGVASGVAASFNAPVAGVFFALEVVVGHYGLGAFAPVVVAAVAGTIVSRAHFGDFPAFSVPGLEIASYTEMPAFLLLGVVCAAVAAAFIAGVRSCARLAARLPLPGWIKPALGGLGCGAIALGFPEALGVGYETTDMALAGALDLPLLLALLAAKAAATFLCLGFGFSGGVFSPSLCIGALAGAAFGVAASAAAPEVGASVSTYGLAGMGAVAAAVLGAPISTILIVFELTGDLTVTVAVMIAVAAASPICRRIAGGSWFTLQLAARGIDLSRAPGRAAAADVSAADLMTSFRAADETTTIPRARELARAAPRGDLYAVDSQGRLAGVATLARLHDPALGGEGSAPPTLGDIAETGLATVRPGDALDRVLERLDTAKRDLPVVDAGGRPVGVVRREDALAAHNRALLREHAIARGQT